MTVTNNGFTLLLHGELWFTRDQYTAWQLPSMVPVVGIDLEKAVRDPEAFEEAARIIGRVVMERGVRYAARGARQWTKAGIEAKAKAKETSKAAKTLAKLRVNRR